MSSGNPSGIVFPRNQCAIAGIGTTEFSKAAGRSELTMAIEVASAAAADAGLDLRQIDGIVMSDSDNVAHNDLVEALGLPNITYWGTSGPGGIAPAGLIAQAVGAIMTGQASTVFAFRSLRSRSGRRLGSPTVAAEVGGNSTYSEFFAPYGLLSAGQVHAMLARRHMIEFGTTQEDLGAIAVACRNRANANPAAQMHGRPMTLETYLDSPVIADPLLRPDFCLETDAACGVIVTSTDRARDLRQPPTLIRAIAQSSGAGVQGGVLSPVLMRESITTMPSRHVADTLYRRADVSAADIDVAQLYDCFTITLLLELEDYGFCAKGEGGPFASSGAIELGGEIPINTAGGHLSEGYVQGMNHILEGVRQIRGISTNQVQDAQLCLVTSSPPPASGAILLERAR